MYTNIWEVDKTKSIIIIIIIIPVEYTKSRW